MNSPQRKSPAMGGPGGADTQTANRAKLQTNYNITLARFAIEDAQFQLSIYALNTDEPDWRAVDAADCLDAAVKSLSGVRDG